MRRKRSLIIFSSVTSIVLAFVAVYLVFQIVDTPEEVETDTRVENERKDPGKSENEEKDQAPVSSFDHIEEKVNQLVEQMTLKEKIGQLMVVGFQSNEVDSHIQTMIQEYKVGGVILFDRNMETPEQVAALNNQLQNLAMENEHQIPLFISVDQEGGQIVRMKDQVSPIPSQQTLGQQNDPNEVYRIAQRTGKELAAMGFGVNYAPVLDLSSTDSRSFGEDPDQASILGNKVVTGLMDSGMIATLKHFPGNGRSTIEPMKKRLQSRSINGI